jgi:hypothetical protein
MNTHVLQNLPARSADEPSLRARVGVTKWRTTISLVRLTLRLRLAEGPDYHLRVDAGDRHAAPREILRANADANGRIALGDRRSCSIDDVIDVDVVQPEPVEGPTFERGLQDEDVATALSENYEPPALGTDERRR